ncbi:MAG: hypothetical protein IKN47_02035 [Lachnospiraceae bacterium]|nr:hypothetical protein [Lachnospiraceae bacterium]
MFFKCRNCGGNIVYNPDKKAMCCPHCESLDSEEKVDSPALMETLKVTCASCGAPVDIKEHTSATRCPNCGNYFVIDERVTGNFKPHLIIPFKLGKDTAKELLRKEFDKRPFTPQGFMTNASLDKMEGNYVPFFMYDYHSDMSYQAVGTKVRHWSDSSYEYTETSYYDVTRDMNADFDRVPVDASIEMDDGLMDLIEPYNYSELEEHQDKYLSGFLSEKYNMGEKELTPRAEQKVLKDSQDMLHASVSGYATLTEVTETITPTKKAVDYALLPVWEYIYGYQGKQYKYHVNGQTGKVLGETPVAKGKVIAYGCTVFGIMAVFGFLIRAILLVM